MNHMEKIAEMLGYEMNQVFCYTIPKNGTMIARVNENGFERMHRDGTWAMMRGAHIIALLTGVYETRVVKNLRPPKQYAPKGKKARAAWKKQKAKEKAELEAKKNLENNIGTDNNSAVR